MELALQLRAQAPSPYSFELLYWLHGDDSIVQIFYCFCFQVTGFFYQNSEFISSFKGLQKTYWKTKDTVNPQKANIFGDIIMLILLAKCHQMYIDGKVNQGPLYDVNVLFNR